MNLNDDAMLVSLAHHRLVRPALRPRGEQPRRRAPRREPRAPDATTSACCPRPRSPRLTATMSAGPHQAHYSSTRLPWDDQGSRLLTVANYEHYTELLDGLRERVVRQRARFIEDYDDYVDQARLDLGKLFRIEDYPVDGGAAGQVRHPLPHHARVQDADHFIAKLA